jgi:hypothetical protein
MVSVRKSLKQSKLSGGSRKSFKRSKLSGGRSKRRSKGRSGKKRPLNKYFKAMLNAKKQNLPSFKYGTKTYVRVKHAKLGSIYKSK